jgi:hypothetical protein
MKSRNVNQLGGMQSLFFCAGIYLVALFFSIFVCSSIFYAFNSKATNVKAIETQALASVK